MKEQWLILVTKVEPHMQSLSAKALEFYKASKTAVMPHVIKVQDFVDPYFQVKHVQMSGFLYPIPDRQAEPDFKMITKQM